MHNVGQYSEIVPGKRINVVNGEIKWHIDDFTPDMDKYKVILAFEKAFQIWQLHFNPIVFKSTATASEAQIILHFANNGDSDLPISFDTGVLAYAFAPVDGTSDIWFNDVYKWAEMHSQGYINLQKVTVHELGHSFNLDHSSDNRDIMFPSYSPNDTINITQDTIDGIKDIYREFLVPTDPDYMHMVEFLKELFPRWRKLKILTEPQLLVIAEELDIDAKLSDLKLDTINKIWKALHSS